MASAVLVELKASATEFMATMGEAQAKVAKLGTESSGHLQKFGAVGQVAFAALGAGALAFGATAVKMGADFQESLTQLSTGAGESQKNLAMVGAGINKMAGQVGQTSQALVAGMYNIESAGYHGAAGLNILRIAAEGARVGNADMATVADALTSALNAYKQPASDAAQVTNTLIATVASGKMHMQDLASSLGTVLPSAAALHIPLQQVGAAIATMTAQGTAAADASTYLRFTLGALANPTSKAAGEMKKMGLSSAEVATTLTHQGLPAALQMLTDAVGKHFPAGSAQYIAALANMVGGTKGMQAALELTGQNAATFNANVKNITGSTTEAGTSVAGWAEVQKDFNFKIAAAKDGLQGMVTQIGVALLPAVTRAMQAVQAMAGWLIKHKEAAEALAVALGGVLGGVMVAFAAKQAVEFVNACKKIAISLGLVAAGEEEAGVASASMAGPIGLALAAIALAAFELYKHWDAIWGTIKRVIGDAVAWIRSHALLIGAAFGPVGIAIALLATHWSTVWNGIRTVIEDVWSVIKPILDAITSAAHAAGDAIGKVAGAAGKVGGAVSSVGHFLGFASGTDYAPGGLSLVGEEGPELVNLPRGSQVIPNNRLGGGGDTIIHINVAGSVLTPVDLADAVHTALLRKQRRTGALGLT